MTMPQQRPDTWQHPIMRSIPFGDSSCTGGTPPHGEARYGTSRADRSRVAAARAALPEAAHRPAEDHRVIINALAGQNWRTLATTRDRSALTSHGALRRKLG